MQHTRVESLDLANLGWGLDQLGKISIMGYHTESVKKSLVALPSQNLSEIDAAIKAFEAMPKTPKIISSTTLASSPFGASWMAGSEHIWDMSTDVGFATVAFDPASLSRRRLIANPRIADILGMHHEEYLARTASRDLPLPCTEIDSLLLFLFMTVRDIFIKASPREVYLRAWTGAGAARRGLLVHICSITAFRDGQPSEVFPPPRCAAPRASL